MSHHPFRMVRWATFATVFAFLFVASLTVPLTGAPIWLGAVVVIPVPFVSEAARRVAERHAQR